jgi:anti-anti-sigma regulatory factor
MGVLHRHRSSGHRDQRGLSSGRGAAGVRVAASGALGVDGACRLEDAFNHALDEGAAAVLVDMSAVIASDSAIVHTLLRMVDQGHCVPLEFRLSAAVERLLASTGVSHHLVAEPGGPSRRRRRRGRRSRLQQRR